MEQLEQVSERVDKKETADHVFAFIEQQRQNISAQLDPYLKSLVPWDRIIDEVKGERVIGLEMTGSEFAKFARTKAKLSEGISISRTNARMMGYNVEMAGGYINLKISNYELASIRASFELPPFRVVTDNHSDKLGIVLKDGTEWVDNNHSDIAQCLRIILRGAESAPGDMGYDIGKVAAIISFFIRSDYDSSNTKHYLPLRKLTDNMKVRLEVTVDNSIHGKSYRNAFAAQCERVFTDNRSILASNGISSPLHLAISLNRGKTLEQLLGSKKK